MNAVSFRFSFLGDFDDSLFVKTSTPEEWIAQGDYYAKHQCWKVRAWPVAGAEVSAAGGHLRPRGWVSRHHLFQRDRARVVCLCSCLCHIGSPLPEERALSGSCIAAQRHRVPVGAREVMASSRRGTRLLGLGLEAPL